MCKYNKNVESFLANNNEFFEMENLVRKKVDLMVKNVDLMVKMGGLRVKKSRFFLSFLKPVHFLVLYLA